MVLNNPVASRKRKASSLGIPPFHSHDAFYTLSTFVLSSRRHSFAGRCTRAYESVALNPRICESTRSQFISATAHPSRTSLSRKGLQFRNPAIQQRDGLPTGWSSLGCYTWVPPTVFYEKVHFLTLNRISDDPSFRTLTSGGFTDSTGMTVELCVNLCQNFTHIYAGVENGTDCCKCMSEHYLQGALQLRGFLD